MSVDYGSDDPSETHVTTTFTPDAVTLLAVLRGPQSGRASKLYSTVHSLLDLDEVAREGLPKESLTAVVGAATRSASEAVTALTQRHSGRDVEAAHDPPESGGERSHAALGTPDCADPARLARQ